MSVRFSLFCARRRQVAGRTLWARFYQAARNLAQLSFQQMLPCKLYVVVRECAGARVAPQPPHLPPAEYLCHLALTLSTPSDSPLRPAPAMATPPHVCELRPLCKRRPPWLFRAPQIVSILLFYDAASFGLELAWSAQEFLVSTIRPHRGHFWVIGRILLFLRICCEKFVSMKL